MGKKRNKKKMNDESDSKKQIEGQLKNINVLATRLPWIAVIIVLISMVLIMLEIYFKGG